MSTRDGGSPLRRAAGAGALTAAGLLACQQAAWAQAEGAATQRIEVTGTALPRIDATAALPLQVIDAEAIRRSGAATVEQLLQQLTAASGVGALSSASPSTSPTGGIAAVSLRGLGSLRTLVLVNGRRIAPYGIGNGDDSASVNVNALPLAAIERVEVLKEGASAVYGSDAIGGVVNLVLKRQASGATVELERGSAVHGGGGLKRGSVVWGRPAPAEGGAALLLGASWVREGALMGAQRDYASRSYNLALRHDITSAHGVPANVAAVDGSFFGSPAAPTGCAPPASVQMAYDPGSCHYDPAGQVTLLPQAERIGLFGNATVPLQAGAEVFVDASYTHNSQRTRLQGVPVSEQFALPAGHPLAGLAPYNVYTPYPSAAFVLSPSSPYYPTSWVQAQTGGATPDLLTYWRGPQQRDFTDVADAPRLVAGVRGPVRGWDVETALLASASRVREQMHSGYPQYSKLLPLLNSGQVNPFGASTPEVEAQLAGTAFIGDAFRAQTTLFGLDAKATRRLDLAGLPDTGVALGAELRREGYRFEPAPELAAGDVAGFGGTLGHAERSRWVASLHGELNLLLRPGLEADTALRLDRYEGVGSAATPQVALRWRPSPTALLRAGAGTAFRAPSLAELYAPSTTSVSQPGLSDPLRCAITGDPVRDCKTQFAVTLGGNPALRPERSAQWNLGAVLAPQRALQFSADLFHVALRNTIQPGLPQTLILSDPARYGGYVVRGPSSGGLPGAILGIDQHSLNVGRTEVAGVDLGAQWRRMYAGLGNLAYGLEATYVLRHQVTAADGSTRSLVGRADASASGGVVPRWHLMQRLALTRQAWDASLAWRWYSRVWDVPGTLEDPASPGYVPRKVAAYSVVDAQLTHAFSRRLSLTLSVRNLFDRVPPYTRQSISFQQGYDPQAADPLGRFVALRARCSFD